MDKDNNKLLEQLKKDMVAWEGQEIEFIQDFPENTHEIAKEMAAFSTSNDGRIYLGVDKNKKMIGISKVSGISDSKSKDDILNRLAGIIKNNVKPSISPTIQFINIEENNVVLLRIDVPKGTEPVYYTKNGIPYIRILSTSDVATADQVKELNKKYFQRQGLFVKRNIGRLPLRFRLERSEKIYKRPIEPRIDEITGKLENEEDVPTYNITMKNIETHSISDIRLNIHNRKYAISHLGPGEEYRLLSNMKEDEITLDQDWKIYVNIEDLIYVDADGNRFCVEAVPAGLYEYLYSTEIDNLAKPKICDEDIDK